jgi:hypothetical protein
VRTVNHFSGKVYMQKNQGLLLLQSGCWMSSKGPGVKGLVLREVLLGSGGAVRSWATGPK